MKNLVRMDGNIITLLNIFEIFGHLSLRIEIPARFSVGKCGQSQLGRKKPQGKRVARRCAFLSMFTSRLNTGHHMGPANSRIVRIYDLQRTEHVGGFHLPNTFLMRKMDFFVLITRQRMCSDQLKSSVIIMPRSQMENSAFSMIEWKLPFTTPTDHRLKIPLILVSLFGGVPKYLRVVGELRSMRNNIFR